MKYFEVCVFGKDINEVRVHGCHIIRAKSRKNALEIRERHKISNPFGAEGNFRISCEEIKLKGYFKKDNLALLERRRKGQGGSIWYEDENGNLQREIK